MDGRAGNETACLADERRRLARQLHDLVAHAIAVALQNLELFAVHRDHDPARAADKLDAALSGLRETLDLVRGLSRDLRRSAEAAPSTSPVGTNGIEAALRRYVAANPAAGVPTEVRVYGDDTCVPRSVLTELYLVLREAVRNAQVHSGGTAIDVIVHIEQLRIRALVVDDGHGFDDTVASAGTGLVSMRERVALLGGVLEVQAVPGRGTTVAVEVPLPVGEADG